jgi:hypothetical protein
MMIDHDDAAARVRSERGSVAAREWPTQQRDDARNRARHLPIAQPPHANTSSLVDVRA